VASTAGAAGFNVGDMMDLHTKALRDEGIMRAETGGQRRGALL
jgi:hypothetical protein